MIKTCGVYLYSVPVKKFLLCHATRSGNQWSIPKGLPEEGEKKIEAAFRELKEETGIDIEDLEIVDVIELPEQKYAKQNKFLTSFLVVIKDDLSEFPCVCSSLVNNLYPEIDRFRWCDLADFRLMAHESQVRNLDEIQSVLDKTGT